MQLRIRTAPPLARPLDVHVDGALTLAVPGPDGRNYVSGASGIATVAGAAWVVSDTLATPVRYGDWNAPGFVQHGLPVRGKKYDLESVTAVPDAHGGVALLALGSGSSAKRDVGWYQPVDAAGIAVGESQAVDVAKLYKSLATHVDGTLNIEGSAVRQGLAGAELLLFHRGREAGDTSRIFVLDAAAVVHAAREHKAVSPAALRATVVVDLGTLADGSRLAFSDARVLADGRIAFAASSEAVNGTGDGAISGSAIGLLDRDFHVTELHPLAGPARKVEGIALARDIDPSAPADRVLLITDPDDDTVAGERLHVDLGTPLSAS